MRALTTDMQVLVVCDQQETEVLWIHCLEQQALRATATSFDGDPRQIASLDAYGLIILDIQDDRDRVLAICRYARATFAGLILLFTYEHDERFHLEAYRAGIDECIAKPIGNTLAVAKVLAWLGHTWEPPGHRYGSVFPASPIPAATARGHHTTTPNFHINTIQRLLITPEGKITKLSKLECRLLTFLYDNHGQIVPPDRLIDQVWTGNPAMNFAHLKNLVYRLRRKIEPDPDRPRYLHTVSGYGYSLDVELHR